MELRLEIKNNKELQGFFGIVLYAREWDDKSCNTSWKHIYTGTDKAIAYPAVEYILMYEGICPNIVSIFTRRQHGRLELSID